MLHFSCDLCGQRLGDRRFVVKLEVFPAYDPEEISEDDLDADHLQDLAESLQEMEAGGTIELEECGPKTLRFDLCPHCRQRFIRDPLGRDALRRLNYSKN